MTLSRALSVLCLLSVSALAASPLGDERMSRANEAAAAVVRERMAQERPEDHRVLQSVEQADIVVVRGEYDRVEDVLTTLKIPHVVVNPNAVARLPLSARQLLIIDCPGTIGGAGLERIRKFVNAGGFLYTTDWALTHVVMKAFPGFVGFNGVQTANDVVEVEPVAAQDNLLKHLTLSRTNPRWWLESSSYPITVLNPQRVNVLISSREMKKKYGESPIAVTFRYGDGQVLHIASHFYLQQNQTRTVAEKKNAKKFLDEDSTLSASTKAAAARRIGDDVVAGDLSSAYAAQQMTSNLVVERKKDQARIDGLYGRRWNGQAVKPLESRGNSTQVRTLDGEERWVPTAEVK